MTHEPVAARWQPLRATGAAVRLLTRAPLPGRHEPADLARAGAAFPAVGAAIAAIGIGVHAGARPLWGTVAATVLAVAATIAVTGALHEDGLADTVDGLWGGHSPQARVAIMRDSHIGVYAVVALVLALALRLALLAPLGTAGFARAVLAGAVTGRGAMAVLAAWLPAPHGGSAATLAGRRAPAGLAVAAVTVLAALVAAVGWWAPAPLAAGAAATGALAWLLRRRLGGVTGDALGFAAHLVDLAVIAAVVALLRGPLG